MISAFIILTAIIAVLFGITLYLISDLRDTVKNQKKAITYLGETTSRLSRELYIIKKEKKEKKDVKAKK